jgi:hypothetical protein
MTSRQLPPTEPVEPSTTTRRRGFLAWIGSADFDTRHLYDAGWGRPSADGGILVGVPRKSQVVFPAPIPLVPTLRVGTHLRTLRVPARILAGAVLVGLRRSATQSVLARVPTRSVGTRILLQL